MPYELSFTRRVHVTAPDEYINECCIGGDFVVDQLLPAVRDRYEAIQSNQEDWGWFIWFRKGKVHLAIDVFTDDPESGAFRIHLTSRVRRLFRLGPAVDNAEIEQVRDLVVNRLKAWGATKIVVMRLPPGEF